MFNIGSPELLVILIVALIVVGPRRLPEIGRTVGRVLNELRKVQDEVRDMVKFDLSEVTADVPETKPVPTPHRVRNPDGPGGEPVEELDEPQPQLEGSAEPQLETVELPTRENPEAGAGDRADDATQAAE